MGVLLFYFIRCYNKAMKLITTSRGILFKICDCHFDAVAQYRWAAYYNPRHRKWDARRVVRIGNWRDNKKQTILMHRYVAGAPKGMVVDHRNGDTQDNQCSNLRICNQSQNNANQQGAKIGSSSGVKGVYWHKGAKKWCAEVIYEKKKYYLGLFDTLEEARDARNEKAKELHGEFYYPA